VQQSTTPSSTPQKHHRGNLPLSPPPGDADSHPKIEVFVVPKNTELATPEADFSLVLVALIGGNQPAVSPEAFWAHLASMYEVSEGASSVDAWLGGNFACECQLDSRPSSSCEVVGLEAEANLVLGSRLRQLPPVVDSTLDPILIEAAIQVLPPNRRSTLEPSHGDKATIVIDDPSDVQPFLTSPREMVMLGAPRDSSSDDDAGRPTSSGPIPPMIQETLEARICLPLQTPLIRGPPRLRRPRMPVSVQSLRRNERLAAKPREVDSTKQAQCVLMQKLGIIAKLAQR
jgi:hypothetical protein